MVISMTRRKEAYEADRKKVEEQQLDDHYLCTDIDRMENIARQVPLSAMERPAWDTKVLESLGVCSIRLRFRNLEARLERGKRD